MWSGHVTTPYVIGSCYHAVCDRVTLQTLQDTALLTRKNRMRKQQSNDRKLLQSWFWSLFVVFIKMTFEASQPVTNCSKSCTPSPTFPLPPTNPTFSSSFSQKQVNKQHGSRTQLCWAAFRGLFLQSEGQTAVTYEITPINSWKLHKDNSTPILSLEVEIFTILI